MAALYLAEAVGIMLATLLVLQHKDLADTVEDYLARLVGLEAVVVLEMLGIM